MFQEYIKKYGKPDQERLQTRGVKLTKNSPYVQKVIKLREELGSTNAVAKELGKDNK